MVSMVPKNTELDHGGICSLSPEAQVQSGGIDRMKSKSVGTCIVLEMHVGVRYQPSHCLMYYNGRSCCRINIGNDNADRKQEDSMGCTTQLAAL